MKLKFLRSAVLVATLGVVCSASAQVASTTSDLILGFRQGNTSNSLEINLGNINSFTGASASGISGTLSLGNISSVLTTAYGAGWASDSTLVWAAAGTAGTGGAATNGQAARTFWVTNRWTDAGSALGVANDTAYGNIGTSLAGTAASNIGSVYNGLSLASSGQTLDSDTVLLPAGGNAWVTKATTGANSFGVTGLTTAKFVNPVTNTFTGYSASDLYSITPTGGGTSTNLFFGTFALSNTGELSFTGSNFAAIPEPSTYAAMFGAAALGLVIYRRRQQAKAAQAA
ncbi:PEP-CTERM sorting domain-containing protein [Oleiharenicola lentus]|uniref:PEP-CTERM sorting domain-containing protein n=1 Tax=Oleiharenicola lentus TaxID=2508720 RepID=UPI003F666A88